MGSILGVVGLMTITTSGIAQVSYDGPSPVSTHPGERVALSQSGKAQTLVTLSIKDSTLKYAVQEIARQAGVRIVYDNSSPLIGKRVTAELKRATVVTAFETVLKGSGLVAKLAPDGETVVISKPAVLSPRDGRDTSGVTSTGTIFGTVVDSANRKGISGATVTVIGTSLSVTTSHDGTFLIRDVPVGGHRIYVRIFGYQARAHDLTIAPNERTVVRLSLLPVATTLSDVVTTATGKQRRLEIPTDVTRVNVDSIMAIAPIRSVTDLLETRVPGLTVLRTSGTPGDPARIRLRGVSSVNGDNSPIVIVDGVRVYAPDGNRNSAVGFYPREVGVTGDSTGYAAPSPLDQIDPNTIETIEVFKGPSASSLYGSDAANGVILITTKRGQPGKMRVNAAADFGTSSIPGQYPENAFLFGRLFNESSSLCQFNDGCEIDSLVMFQALNDPRYRPLGGATSFRASGTLSGGTSTVRYSFTGSASTQQGVVRLPEVVRELYRTLMASSPPSWMVRPDRYWIISGENNVEISLTPTLDVRLSNAITSSEQQRSSLGNRVAAQLIDQYINPDLIGIVGASTYYEAFHERAVASTLRSQHTLSLRWQARPSVPVNLTSGINPSVETGTALAPAGLPRALVGGTDKDGYYSAGQAVTLMSSMGANTTIPVRLIDNVTVPLAVGGDWRLQRHRMQQLVTTQVPEGVTEPTNFGNGSTTASRRSAAVATYGWFLEPRINFGERLFAQTGMRLDGGSASGGRAGLTGYPKLGLSWIAIDRNSDPSSAGWWQWILQLRLRGALGMAGVQPQPTQHLRMWRPTSVSFDGGQTTVEAWTAQTMGNSKLRPERATEFEGGGDLTLLENRLSLSATMYRKSQRNAIFSASLAPSVGGPGEQAVNIGDIMNTGYELTANAVVIDTRPFRWDLNAQFSHRKNRLTAIADGVNTRGGNTSQTKLVVGYPLYSFWARPIAGFADMNEDGLLQKTEIVLADSSVYLGSSDPRYSVAISTSMGAWNGRLQLSVSLDYQRSMTQLNALAKSAFWNAAALPNATLFDQAIAIVSGRVGLIGDTEGDTKNVSTPYYAIQTVNVLRFQSLAVSAMLPSSLLKWLRASHGTIALQGRNLGIRSSYQGLDPNVNVYTGGGLSRDTGQIPQPREWVMRVTLSR